MSNYPVKEAGQVLGKQFGTFNPKLALINQEIWDFFVNNEGEGLTLSAMKTIAAKLDVDVDLILSVVGLFSGGTFTFLTTTYFEIKADGKKAPISSKEVHEKTVKLYNIFHQEWEEWASKIIVCWLPTNNLISQTQITPYNYNPKH